MTRRDDGKETGVLRRRGAATLDASLLLLALAACALAGAAAGCKQVAETVSVRPRALRDVPAARLAFRFEPDVNASGLPDAFDGEEADGPLAPIKNDFETRRKEEALLRTVVSPDGQRALALYATADTPEGDFRMDLYSSEGAFLRNILPQDLSGTFPQTVAWSPSGQQIAFIGIKNAAPQPTPSASDLAPPSAAPPVDPGTAGPAPTVAPIIPPVPTFSTEQVYLSDRDGFGIKPLTTRDGLIYFHLAWAPDNHALAALACKPEEWDARRKEDKRPAGRPRLIDLEGRERLLADRMAEAAPVWSPDASKVATAFETDLAIYDAAGDAPTGAVIPLREPLLAASAQYDAQKLTKQTDTVKANAGGAPATESAPAPAAAGDTPLSFNPVVHLEWQQPETLFARTAFLRLYKSGELIRNYPRWHAVHLSPQAALVSDGRRPENFWCGRNPTKWEPYPLAALPI
ncbi:MAG: hypothetical protein ACRD68_08585 [Pyrinomonadaceae bacterium]